jgi:ABC-type lipoprotein release transport system permease subunit
MTLGRLIAKELRHRWLNGLLSLLSVAAAAGCLIGALVLLKAFDLRTDRIIEDKQNRLQEQMARMEDEYRKITKRMGFNVLILPKDQNLADFYAEHYAEKTMPQDYAHRLANARDVVTIRHLLPMLQQKITWPEKRRKILLIGVQGEMPWAHRAQKAPILKPVPPDAAVIGYELGRSENLKAGDTLTLMGRTFKVKEVQPERGSIDDITVWIDLDQAQQMLDRKGLINAMMALECQCAWANLPMIRKEIQGILPDTQVVELAGKAIARAEARMEARRNAEMAIEREKKGRAELRRKREELVAVLVPLVICACAVWVGLLAFLNVRERRVEIGILRAVGLRRRDILVVFLGKAATIGLLGAAFGLVLGSLIGAAVSELPEGAASAAALPRPLAYVAVALLAPCVTVIASWLPSLIAAQQDPAVVLRTD